nr:DUF1156 domain-containing protein [Pelobacter propionicus]
MIEIPPKHSGITPIGPIPKSDKQLKLHNDWSKANGLAEDVRRYGIWIKGQVYKRLENLYPQIEITAEEAKNRPELKPLIGEKLTVIAWIWARTVRSPNPAFSHVEVPLTTTFYISSKATREAYIEPIIDGDKYHFVVHTGKPTDIESVKSGTKLARGANFKCLLSGTPIDSKYIKSEGLAGRIGSRLLAIITEGPKGKIYLSPTEQHEEIVRQANPNWKPNLALPDDPRNFWTLNYGLGNYGDLFTPRQLVALSTFSEVIQEARTKIDSDIAKHTEKNKDQKYNGYSEAICVYLALAVGRCANYWSSLTPWGGDFIVQTFGRNAIPMIWDHAEGNPFSSSTGNWLGAIDWINRVLKFAIPANSPGHSTQFDAQTQTISKNKVISTDPPYYDNISYSDLSDFFYIWLRHVLKPIIPELFQTLSTPKGEELIAQPYRQGGKEASETFFLNGMTIAMTNIANQANKAFPVTIYYAFKQSKTNEAGTASTGWETFLEAVLNAGFYITGTWPLRTERDQGLKTGTNALASSIILVCRMRESDALSISRREFQRELKEAMPEALEDMIGGKEGMSPIAPVDLAQAAIGPGMAVFSKYEAVIEADGQKMTVHTALTLINKEIDDYFGGQSFDADTNFCISWFEENDWRAGQFGQADILSRAKGTTVDGVKEAGVIESGAGRVRLLKYSEYPADWDPGKDNRTPAWESLHQLIRAIQSEGETAAGILLARMPERGESIRQLSYRLYTLCERNGWAEDARPYNELIAAWHEVEKISHEVGHTGSQIEMNLQ